MAAGSKLMVKCPKCESKPKKWRYYTEKRTGHWSIHETNWSKETIQWITVVVLIHLWSNTSMYITCSLVQERDRLWIHYEDAAWLRETKSETMDHRRCYAILLDKKLSSNLDFKALCAIFSHGGNNCSHPCPYCYVTLKDLHDLSKALKYRTNMSYKKDVKLFNQKVKGKDGKKKKGVTYAKSNGIKCLGLVKYWLCRLSNIRDTMRWSWKRSREHRSWI